MIRLEGVSKYFPTPAGRVSVLDDISFDFVSGVSFGIMGEVGAGKSTLIKLLANVERPSSGVIRRHARVSWPVSCFTFLHSLATGEENVRFVSRVYGADHRSVSRFVTDFAEIQGYFDAPIRTYSSAMRARLAFGLAIALDFDVYVVDELVLPGGDATFQERCNAALRDFRKRAAVIMASHDPATLVAYCDRGIILEKGKLKTFPTVDASIAAYQRQQKQPERGE